MPAQLSSEARTFVQIARTYAGPPQPNAIEPKKTCKNKRLNGDCACKKALEDRHSTLKEATGELMNALKLVQKPTTAEQQREDASASLAEARADVGRQIEDIQYAPLPTEMGPYAKQNWSLTLLSAVGAVALLVVLFAALIQFNASVETLVSMGIATIAGTGMVLVLRPSHAVAKMSGAASVVCVMVFAGIVAWVFAPDVITLDMPGGETMSLNLTRPSSLDPAIVGTLVDGAVWIFGLGVVLVLGTLWIRTRR